MCVCVARGGFGGVNGCYGMLITCSGNKQSETHAGEKHPYMCSEIHNHTSTHRHTHNLIYTHSGQREHESSWRAWVIKLWRGWREAWWECVMSSVPLHFASLWPLTSWPAALGPMGTHERANVLNDWIVWECVQWCVCSTCVWSGSSTAPPTGQMYITLQHYQRCHAAVRI